MTYAIKLGILYAAFFGETRSCRAPAPSADLRTGQQVSLSPDEAVELIRKGISELNKGSGDASREIIFGELTGRERTTVRASSLPMPAKTVTLAGRLENMREVGNLALSTCATSTHDGRSSLSRRR